MFTFVPSSLAHLIGDGLQEVKPPQEGWKSFLLLKKFTQERESVSERERERESVCRYKGLGVGV